MVKRKIGEIAEASRESEGKRKAPTTSKAKDAVSLRKQPASSVKTKAVTKKPLAESEGIFRSQLGLPVSVQIVTGSYERVLHGFAATLQSDLSRPVTNGSGTEASSEVEIFSQAEGDQSSTLFTDTFLFAAHSSSIRSLALSNSAESHKCVLATGGTDERINLYTVSTTAPQPSLRNKIPTLNKTTVLENPKNREIGTLLHHARAVTKLHFPTKGKLFSAAEDNTIAISRTRDWTVLSTIKVPIPKPIGRPSGDTAAVGTVPAGVNDFAIHPSMKLMVSVGKGEKCMRLWNLVTGKKAGVLTFERDLLQQAGEGRYGSGEGRRVLWSNSGDDFVVAFERGAVIYGMDSRPKATIKCSPLTKIHQLRFVPKCDDAQNKDILAVSTEDGRIVFFDLGRSSLSDADAANGTSEKSKTYPVCSPIGQVGGLAVQVLGRVKDFELLPLPAASRDAQASLLLVTASSDGAVRLWKLESGVFQSVSNADEQKEGSAPEQIGTLLGTNETGHRITCLTAFVMDAAAEDAEDEDEDEFGGFSDAVDAVESDSDSEE